jgi:hypothetical protein
MRAEESVMILTRKDLKEYQENMRISISDDLEKELMDRFRHFEIDDDGHVREYTEQDIYEQIRKIIRDKELLAVPPKI